MKNRLEITLTEENKLIAKSKHSVIFFRTIHCYEDLEDALKVCVQFLKDEEEENE